MSKLQLVLLALFILGLVGAINSISNQSTVVKEKSFVGSVLSLFGLAYEPEAEPPRELDFVPGKVTSEVSKLTPESLKASPTPATGSGSQNQTQTFSSPRPANGGQNISPKASPAPSGTNQYNFSFSNELPIPPIAPNQQTLGIKTQKAPLYPSVHPSQEEKNLQPPVPPIAPNLNLDKKSSDIIDKILEFLSAFKVDPSASNKDQP